MQNIHQTLPLFKWADGRPSDSCRRVSWRVRAISRRWHLPVNQAVLVADAMGVPTEGGSHG
jgi:hypothetical protein